MYKSLDDISESLGHTRLEFNPLLSKRPGGEPSNLQSSPLLPPIQHQGTCEGHHCHRRKTPIPADAQNLLRYTHPGSSTTGLEGHQLALTNLPALFGIVSGSPRQLVCLGLHAHPTCQTAWTNRISPQKRMLLRLPFCASPPPSAFLRSPHLLRPRSPSGPPVYGTSQPDLFTSKRWRRMECSR